MCPYMPISFKTLFVDLAMNSMSIAIIVDYSDAKLLEYDANGDSLLSFTIRVEQKSLLNLKQLAMNFDMQS